MKKIDDSPKLTIVTPTFNLIKNGRENLFRNIVDIIQLILFKSRPIPI